MEHGWTIPDAVSVSPKYTWNELFLLQRPDFQQLYLFTSVENVY